MEAKSDVGVAAVDLRHEVAVVGRVSVDGQGVWFDFSLLGEGSTLIVTGSDSPWNQSAMRCGLGSDFVGEAGREVVVDLRPGRKDHISFLGES